MPPQIDRSPSPTPWHKEALTLIGLDLPGLTALDRLLTWVEAR